LLTLHSLIWKAYCNTPKSWQRYRTKHKDWQAWALNRNLIPLWLANALGSCAPNSHFWNLDRGMCLSGLALLSPSSYLVIVVLRRLGIIICYLEHLFFLLLKAAIWTFLIKLAHCCLKLIFSWKCSLFYWPRFRYLLVFKKSFQM
jgi:hypothetical protein